MIGFEILWFVCMRCIKKAHIYTLNSVTEILQNHSASFRCLVIIRFLRFHLYQSKSLLQLLKFSMSGRSDFCWADKNINLQFMGDSQLITQAEVSCLPGKKPDSMHELWFWIRKPRNSTCNWAFPALLSLFSYQCTRYITLTMTLLSQD